METPAPANDRPALWNPNAAAAWSVLFTPAFGAWLHALNWRALGDRDREQASMAWVAAGVVLLVVYLLIDATVPSQSIANEVERTIEFVFFVAWYFASARAQAKLVRDRYARAFERKAWGKPLLMGLAGVGIYIAVTVAIAAAIGVRNNIF
jgi:hypothetical protein